MKLAVHSNIHDYEVLIEQTPEFIDTLASHQQACFVIDENVWNIYSKNLLKDLPIQDTIILPINEKRKNLDSVQTLYDRLVEFPSKRNLTMVSIGGGILQDITGFTASTIYRGINWIYVPTTLLAQADSCIGSKTSLNYRNYKNLVGTFFPPTQIYIYPAFLGTQLDVDFYSGFGEVIKLHLMGGGELVQEIIRLTPHVLRHDADALRKVIQQSLDVKISYLAGDEFDTGRRNLLNYGHDFGHALESTSDFSIPHGQAVIFGMLAANLIAKKRGVLSSRLEREIAETLLIPNLVFKPSKQALNKDVIIDAMKKDKKRTGEKLALIMMTDGFNFMRVNDLTTDDISSALTNIHATYLS